MSYDICFELWPEERKPAAWWRKYSQSVKNIVCIFLWTPCRHGFWSKRNMHSLDYAVSNFNGSEEHFRGMSTHSSCDLGEKRDRWNSIFIKINWPYEHTITESVEKYAWIQNLVFFRPSKSFSLNDINSNWP